MRLSLLSMSLLGLTLACAPLGCSSVEEDDSATAEGELRSLTANEVVGEIAYGEERMEIQHPGEDSSRRRYVAVRFEANAGDEIEATAIAGNAADPVLYLLGDRFQTLASNDDRAPGDEASSIARKIGRSGTHYLAMRTKEGWRTKFYVSLKKKGEPASQASWRTALGGHDLWGATFANVISSRSYPHSNDIAVACKIRPAKSKIECSAHSFDYGTTSATINEDGTFDFSAGASGQAGGELRGSIAADGKVTLLRFRRTECFRTSSSWCETRETNQETLPATAQAFELCRTRDVTFAQGGSASGYHLACSECDGRCEGDR